MAEMSEELRLNLRDGALASIFQPFSQSASAEERIG
jgi:hypothetical protein